MSYTALYRKWRPREFEDVKGQDHIVTTLKNQINADRIGHAYLFCGTRGTGKTTVAKIFAKAVNCEHPAEGSPCGVCPSCKSIGAGTSMNVIEIDAASNNGVDNIREIREEVSYSPTEGKYKVYIIDEVHMLSIGAFNALLKTLEEPPSYVIFILATTEAHKIPITILSRCQRYDFKRITIDTISERLMALMEEEKVEVEERAIRYIAKAADGSMRDALSLLDQCIAFYLGKRLTYDNVLEVLGAVDTEVFSRMLRRLLERDVAGAIHQLEELIMQGRELSQFVNDFTWYLRNLLLVRSSDKMEDVLDVSSENLARLKEEAQLIEDDCLMRYIRIFSELSSQIRYAGQKRVLIEIAIIKLCNPAMEPKEDSLLERIRAVEERLENGVFSINAAPPAGSMAQGAGTLAPARQPGANGTGGSGTDNIPLAKPVLPKAIPEDIQAVVKEFRRIIRSASGLMQAYLKNAGLSLGGDNRLMIVVEDPIAFHTLTGEKHKQELKDLLTAKTGKDIELEIRLNDTGRDFNTSFVNLEDIIHMDIEIED